MRILKTILVYEWRMLLADRMAHIVILLMLTISAYAIFNGFSGLRVQAEKFRSENEKIDRLYEETWKKIADFEEKARSQGIPADEPSAEINSAHLLKFELSDFTSVLPPNGFAASSIGLREVYPQTLTYQKYRDESPSQPTVGNRSLGNVFVEKNRINPLRMFTGRFDLTFATIFITPLFILALSFNLLSGDKESGVLALMLTNSVSLTEILLGKFLLRLIIVKVFAVLLPALGIYFGQLLAVGNASFPLFLLWTTAAFVYVLFWFAVSFLVGSFGHSSAFNALILSIFWGTLTLILPLGINIIAEAVYPPVPGIQYTDEAHKVRLDAKSLEGEILVDYNTEFNTRFPQTPQNKMREKERLTEILAFPDRNSLLSDYISEHPSIPKNLTYYQIGHLLERSRESYIERKLSPILEQTDRQRNGQRKVVEWLSLLSPAAQTRLNFDEIAGNGSTRHRNFVGQFDEFVRKRDQFYLDKVLAKANVPSGEVSDLPRFVFVDDKPFSVAFRVGGYLLIQLLFTFAAIFSALRLYRKYEPIG